MDREEFEEIVSEINIINRLAVNTVGSAIISAWRAP